MPRPLKHTQIHWNIVSIPCSEHGPHRVIIAGLDVLADDCADIVMQGLRDLGEKATMTSIHIPLDEARRAAGKAGVDVDDIPF
jgi:anaerobic glycerol-3-phosphate dehydrogenase